MRRPHFNGYYIEQFFSNNFEYEWTNEDTTSLHALFTSTYHFMPTDHGLTSFTKLLYLYPIYFKSSRFRWQKM